MSEDEENIKLLIQRSFFFGKKKIRERERKDIYGKKTVYF